MSSNRISKIKRIAILSGLVERYCGESKIVEKVRLAKDLAELIDDLRSMNLEFSRLADEFMNFFPEHWKKRTQFLLIVTKYWPEILEEMALEDIERGRGVVKLESIPHRAPSPSPKVSIVESKDIYAEISSVVEIIHSNPDEKVSIISPNKDFSRYLLLKLDEERIGHNSSIGNSNPSEKFIDEIRDNFKNCSEVEVKQIANELSDLDEVTENSANISVLNFQDIAKIQGGIIIYTELNENDWRVHEPGAFWLHYSLRKKLEIAQDPKLIEDLFYLGIEKSSKTYLLRSLKSNGQSNKKSAILAKFEAMAKKSKIQLDIKAFSRDANVQVKQNDEKINNFKIPPELSTHSIELLMRDPNAFYAKEVLNLKPTDFDEKSHDIMIAFRNLTKNFFENRPLDPWLNIIKNSDFFAYQKAVNLVDFLKKLTDNHSAKNNLLGRFELPQLNINIYGYADRIVENSDFSTLVSFQSSSNQSVKEIIYGNDSSLLTTCLIAEKGGFEKLKKPIRKIQIWNLLAVEKSQITAKEIEISEEIINDFENRLISNLEAFLKNSEIEINCSPAQKRLYNKYKHFERI